MALRPKLSNNKKRKIKMLLAKAFAALQNSEADQCEMLCDEIDAIQPGNADAAYLRGTLAADCDQCEQAETFFKQAIAAAPKQVDFVVALAGLYLSTGENEQAVPVYRQALSIEPHAIYARIGLAGALICLGQYDEAVEILETARKQRPGNIDIRMGLFQACHDSGNVEAARGHLLDILKRDPDNAQAFYSLGLLDIECGELEAGENHVRQAIASNPDYPEAFTVLADLHRFESENDDVFAMRALYDRCPQDSIERMHMAFALAKVNDDLKRYDDAFSMMQEANAIRHHFSRYDEVAELARMQHIIDTCSADLLAKHSQVKDTAPVFVLGMPRSGTSLVEQILAAHPDVCAGGENAMFSDAIADCDPLTVSQWTNEQCQAATEAYLQRLRQRTGDAIKFTDKTLSLMVHIGSIARLLPGAKIVYVQRNALDTCLSIYKNNITGDLFDYGHDLGELGRYYRACEQLMAHWANVLPSGMLMTINYEQLVAEPEQQSRLLVEACGLDWHPACLDFQHAKNRVLTASMTQVRQPVYTRSVDAAHHYQKHLKPLVDALTQTNTHRK